MRRLAAIGAVFALTHAAAWADAAPPMVVFFGVTAGGLTFQIDARDAARPGRPTAWLVTCVRDAPNCALATAKGLIGRRVVGFDGVAFDPDRDLRSQILAAFASMDAPATIEIDFDPETGGTSLPMDFARR